MTLIFVRTSKPPTPPSDSAEIISSTPYFTGIKEVFNVSEKIQKLIKTLVSVIDTKGLFNVNVVYGLFCLNILSFGHNFGTNSQNQRL